MLTNFLCLLPVMVMLIGCESEQCACNVKSVAEYLFASAINDIGLDVAIICLTRVTL